MYLYLFRHGIAYERDEWSAFDDTRPLTPEGMEKTRAVAEHLKAQHTFKVDELWSSPLVRALQTAHIVGMALDLPVYAIAELTAGMRYQQLLACFQKHEALPEHLMLVGHEPDLGLLIGSLSGDPDGDYALKKAGVACLRGEPIPGGMSLLWRLSPKDVC